MKRLSFLILVLTAAPVWAAAPAGQPSGLMMMVPWIAILGIFYFLLIRPQQKQAREHQRLLDNLRRGDRVLTQGGLYGTVVTVKGKVLELKIADNVKVFVSRSHVSQVVETDPALEPEVAVVVNGAKG